MRPRSGRDYWPKAKALLQNPGALLESLMKYDRDHAVCFLGVV